MNPCREHPIVRIIEEIEPHQLMSVVQRRMYSFKDAGVKEYWAVDPDGRRIHVFRLWHEDSPTGGMLPLDWEQIEMEFFGTSGENLK